MVDAGEGFVAVPGLDGQRQLSKQQIGSFADQTVYIFHSCTGLQLGLLLTEPLYSTRQVVEWDEVHFDVRLMQRVPYEGVSRMQTSLRRKHRDRVVRRGLALIIESDFVRSRPPRIHSHHAHHKARLTLAPLARAQYATDAGRQHFADQLTSIRYCVQEVRTMALTQLAWHVRSPGRPRAQTCNFDALYAYLTTSNYDFNVKMPNSNTPQSAQ